MVYPDKARFKSRREVIDVQFKDILNTELLTYKPWKWHWYRFWNRKYRKVGLAQSLRVRDTVTMVRLSCPFVSRSYTSRNGYILDLDQPGEYLKKLNLALDRYQALKRKAKEHADAGDLGPSRTTPSEASSALQPEQATAKRATPWQWIKRAAVTAALLIILYDFVTSFIAGFRAGMH